MLDTILCFYMRILYSVHCTVYISMYVYIRFRLIIHMHAKSTLQIYVNTGKWYHFSTCTVHVYFWTNLFTFCPCILDPLTKFISKIVFRYIQVMNHIKIYIYSAQICWCNDLKYVQYVPTDRDTAFLFFFFNVLELIKYKSTGHFTF